MATEVTIPTIDVPFGPSRTNPQVGRLYPATLEWARGFGLVSDDAAAERLRKYRVDLIASCYAPPSTAGPRRGCSPTG
ncbi:hypothetical protein [Streptomyces abikoensis]|uniref:hypothetical protein n=1 Tax=Streptomyces abikoensis TaxID=97398 RepID=UPI0033C0CC75